MKQIIDQDPNSTQVTFFIIPGFRQSVADDSYQRLIQYLSKKQINIVAVEIHWNHRTMSDYIAEFQIIYHKNKTKVNYVLGFSYGAVVAFCTAKQLGVDRLFLCSLSPDFAEDRLAMSPDVVRYIGKRRYVEVSTRSADSIAKDLKTPTTLFCGERECRQYPQMLVRANQVAKLAKNARLVMAKNAPHAIDFPSYQENIIFEINKILE